MTMFDGFIPTLLHRFLCKRLELSNGTGAAGDVFALAPYRHGWSLDSAARWRRPDLVEQVTLKVVQLPIVLNLLR